MVLGLCCCSWCEVRSPKEFGVLSCEVSQGLGYSCICFLCVVHEAGIKLASSEKTLELVMISCIVST